MTIAPPKNASERRLFWTASALATAYLGIQAIGVLAPSGLNWGIHVFGFLHPSHLIVSGVAFGLVVLLLNRFDPWRLFSRMAVWTEKYPAGTFLAFTLGLALVAMLRQTAVPILGDGYTVLNNLRNTAEGVHLLSTSREPLGMGFFYAVGNAVRWGGAFSPTAAILAGEFILMVIVVACAAGTARGLFPEPGDGRRVLTFLFSLSLPYIQLLFGYAEVYSVTLAALSLTVLGVVLYHRGRMPFYLLPPLFALQAGVHYLGVLLFPLLAYLAHREWKAAGWRQIAGGAALALPIAIAILLWLGWSRIIPTAPHSHILPLSSITDSYTAYTLLSASHLLDVANLLFFLGAVSLLSIALAGKRPGNPGDGAIALSLALAVLPPMLFACVAKFDLGAAKDWDVTASYFYPLGFLGAFRLLGGGVQRIRAMSVIAAAALLSTAAFVNVNADREASLRRVKVLTDPSVMSQGGFYQTTIHLSNAYLETRQVDSMVALWADFLRRYPDDLRGYQKLAKSIWEYGEGGYGRILDVYDVWLARAGGDSTVRTQYARFCVLAGVSSLKAGRMGEARVRFSTAMRLDAEYAAPHYHTGVSFIREGIGDSALTYLERARAADPGNVSTLESIIAARRLTGDSVGTLRAYEAAAAAGSRMAADYLEGRIRKR